MVDRTIVARMKRQRELRIGVGWQEVKVWVPTEADANDVRKLAAERRAKAEALHGITEEIPAVTHEIAARMAKAIAEHGSAAFTTPSGAVLDLMTQLADEDDLTSFSRAVVILARAKPTNAAFVENAVPAKVSNFLVRRHGIDARVLVEWTKANPGWADSVKSAVRNPARFQQVVKAMADEIKRWHVAH